MKTLQYYLSSLIILVCLLPSAKADSQCDNLTVHILDANSFQLSIKSANLGNSYYDGEFQFIGNVNGKWVWKFLTAKLQPQGLPGGCQSKVALAGNLVILSVINASNNSAGFSATFEVTVQGGAYYLVLKEYAVLNNNTGNNHAPVASSLTQQANSTLVYQEVNLIASDEDGDTLSYQLVSAGSGTGYISAYINPLSPKLYVTLDEQYKGNINIQYHVSDGKAFSNVATVTLIAGADVTQRNQGLKELAPEDYAKLKFSSPNGNLFGAPGADPSLPKSIDLSENFPVPGNQGNQSSCVGWATAYALKSYQEKIEMNWSLNASEHLFSPGFIYNQINGGKDEGSYPNEALDLVVRSGAATLATMPYDVANPFLQPGAAAFQEAANFKALSWAAVPNVQAMKATLANRQPLLISIQLYPQFQQLQGSNSVFNDYSGASSGGHAITVVGYDDNKFGGAFKVINSWGPNWGDNGYFWLPYNNSVLKTAYSLTDANNTSIPVKPIDNTEPKPTGALPNFIVQDWHLNYDNRPGGSGQLQYKVSNAGDAVAKSGAYINLVLSNDPQLNNNDIFVVYEPIPFDLNPGEYIFRDQNNEIQFNFSDDLAPGEYYLGLWVDDQNIIDESNEDDNTSLAENKVSFENLLPDLGIDIWRAQLVDQAGNAGLIYTVRNNGLSNAAGGWDINLVLSEDGIIGNEDEYYLFYETVNFELAPGETAFRDLSSPVYFNIYEDMDGNLIPSGDYYMAFWVDDRDVIAESNESNNISFNSQLVPLRARAKKAELPFVNAHNAKVLPDNVQIQKVRITKQANGKAKMTPISKKTTELEQLPKQLSAFDKAVFPLTKGYQMPAFKAVETK